MLTPPYSSRAVLAIRGLALAEGHSPLAESSMKTPAPSLSFDASEIAAAVSDNMMVAARLLREIRDRRARDLPEAARRASIGLRKAHTLARIATLFDGLGVPDDRLEKIGWAKLDIIGGHLAEDARNAGELLTLAESFSQLELKARLQGQVPETRHGSMLLHLPADEDLRFRKLLLQFGARTKGKGLVKKEEALIALMDAFDAKTPGSGGGQ